MKTAALLLVEWILLIFRKEDNINMLDDEGGPIGDYPIVPKE